MGRKLQRDTWAATVHDAIMTLPPLLGRPVHGTEIMDHTGLDYMQVMAGAAWLRDHYPQLPLISGRAGYIYTNVPSAVQAFRRWRARSALTTMRRLLTGAIIPFLRGLPATAANRATQRMFERVIEDLELIIQHEEANAHATRP